MANFEARVEELEEEDVPYEGALTMEIDTIAQRLSPETVNVGTDYALTFDHTHYIRDGFEAYVEWTPDDSDSWSEGDVLDLTYGEELHGIPGVEFRTFHDDLTTYGEHVFDQAREGHLEATFDAAEELDLTLGLDVDYLFDNERDALLDDDGKAAHLGLEGSIEMFDYGVNVVDYEAGDGAQVTADDDVVFEDDGLESDNDDEWEFLAYEASFEVEDVVENLDLRGAYYAYDEEVVEAGTELYDETYDAFEVGASYDLEDTRYAFHLDYANIEAGSWAYSDTTPTDHRHDYTGTVPMLQQADPDAIGSDGAQTVQFQVDVDDVIGFDHYFLVEYWDTDAEVWQGDDPALSDQEDYYIEHGMERSLSEDTELGFYTWYYMYDEDVLDEDGGYDGTIVGDEFDGDEDSRLETEVWLEHELYSW
ncbi:hypothetical protein [Halarsenatibacter silvermanii]|uniref:hypothetical protein n=1 Tax=Halarsenatibacter silvermanii TaxID=321763 RepID=UPI00117BB547|nr:hypothetical protein [Halarsenatibacter silvermanii]